MLNAKGRQNIEGYINLNNIYKIPVTFRNEVAKISYDVYQNVIKKLYYFHKVKNEEEIKKLAL